MAARIFFLALGASLGAVGVACSGDDPAPIRDAAAADVAADVPGSPCGVNNLICKEGAAGKACAIVGQASKCVGTTWTCPAGAISADQCGCTASGTTLPGGDCKAPPPDSGAD